MRKLLICNIFVVIAIVSCGETGPVDSAVIPYFKTTYDECRADFVQIGEELRKSSGATIQSIPFRSKTDTDLTIEVIYLPATKKPEKLVIITSGVHGIEAFASSAVQRYFLEKMLPTIDRSNLGILMVHGVNPYGFRNERRVTENNVDLNRNFDVNEDLFKSKNEGYRSINGLLNPEGKVDPGSFSNKFFAVRAIYNIVKYSMGALRQAALQGQYEFPQGIYYGGSKFESQKRLLEPLFLSTSFDYEYVMLIDLHTGYGERGKLHFFPNAIKDDAIRNRIETVYAGYQVDYGDTEDFYTTTGDFSEYVGKILPNKKYIPMVFEYGTMDSQTTTGSIKSIHNMILENQGYWYGYETEEDKIEVKDRFREHFYPSSPVWRTKIMKTSEEVFPLILGRFQKLNE